MTRFALLIGFALVAAACSTVTPSPPPSAALASPAPTPTLVPTPTPVPPGTCPTGSPIEAGAFVNADPACFGTADVEIRGWLEKSGGIGIEPPVVAPGWLFYPLGEGDIWSQQLDQDGECLDEAAPCVTFFAHVDPASGLELGGDPRWLILTGHVQDPAAETCHWVYPEEWAEPTNNDADAVAACRTSFVLVSIRDAP